MESQSAEPSDNSEQMMPFVVALGSFFFVSVIFFVSSLNKMKELSSLKYDLLALQGRVSNCEENGTVSDSLVKIYRFGNIYRANKDINAEYVEEYIWVHPYTAIQQELEIVPRFNITKNLENDLILKD